MCNSETKNILKW